VRLAYVDTSCLVAVAFDEPGARDMIHHLGDCDRLFASNLLEAELRSALHREGVEEGADSLLAGIGWLHPDRSLRPEIVRSLRHGYVRGADLWHLACALYLRNRVKDLVFLTLDQQQQDAATKLGFGMLE
jgi:hypothetical protein